jgi:CRP-like cAMP-binding protein
VAGLIALSGELPVVGLEPGEVLFEDGSTTGALWILESGSLSVRKGGVELNRVAVPGAVIGEVAALLGAPHGAAVVATEPCRLRYAADGAAFLDANPTAMRTIAVGLAERLHFVTTYLADLKLQYGDAPGLAMVGEVVARLANFSAPAQPTRPTSRRDPDPEY